MSVMIEARIADGEGKTKHANSTILATIDRRDKDLSQLGLTLAQGRSRRPGPAHGFAHSLRLVKSWFESPQVMAGRLAAIDVDGGTPMAEAILWASCELARRPPARRMLFVITDGMPDRLDAAHHCIEIARGNCIHVLGLGIGAAAHAPAVFGESFSAQIERVDQLTGAMVKLVRSMLH